MKGAPALRALLLLCATYETLAECSCIEPDLSQYRDDSGDLIDQPAGEGGVVYSLPGSYGSNECAAHDEGLPPYCSVTNPPSWCAQKWCFGRLSPAYSGTASNAVLCCTYWRR